MKEGLKVKMLERFKLPYMGREVFRTLMRTGLKYDKKASSFYIDHNTNTAVLEKLFDERFGWKLQILKVCTICGTSVDCGKCMFYADCPKKGNTCLCTKCYGSEKLFEDYVEAQMTYPRN
ncbi:MAG: hypothetical protein GTO54_11940 [Nitrososphaeria archaeon]|nr:hypothetical protein [Nitrososphaeria archaeon]NIN53533.1 hypothetical protein [Nitrososphaeria archaeon]